MSLINSPPIGGPLVDDEKYAVNPFGQWLMQVFRICFDVQNSGTTAQRPLINLYPGKTYFDTSLAIPIWFDGAVWIDATGTPV